MANEVNVKWIQVTKPQLESDGVGLSNYTPKDLSNENNTLDFGNVQAGKITSIKCVVAQFSGASEVSELQFWLDSIEATANGSTNQNLNNGWEFYYCIIPVNDLDFNFEETNFTDAQKKGETSGGEASYLSREYRMTTVPRTVDNISPNQFISQSTDNTNPSLVLNIPPGGSAISHLILLDVQTPSDANSGNTEGWSYRMNFLYN